MLDIEQVIHQKEGELKHSIEDARNGECGIDLGS